MASDKKGRYAVPVSCNKDCGAGCALIAVIADGRLVRISDNPERPEYMHGCRKGYGMVKILESPDRLLYPLIRTGERGSGLFRRSSMDEALNLVADKMKEVKKEHGAESLIRLGGSGSCRGALHNTELLTKRFLSLFGGYTDTDGNYSSEASDFVKPFMYGTSRIGIDIRRIASSSAVILWGFNPFDTRFGSETEAFCLEQARRGIPFHVIDPRRTDTVKKLNARWYPVKPGSDGVLFSAIIHELVTKFSDRIPDIQALNRYSTGMSDLLDLLAGKTDGKARTPEWASPFCGLSPGEIRELAAVFVDQKPAALLPGLSIQRTLGGEEADRLAGALQLVSGNAMLCGGTMGSGQWNTLPKPDCGKIPVPENKNIQKVPVCLWPDAILEGRKGGYPGDPKFIYNVGGNFIGQGSDFEKSRRAFSAADFVVVHDYFLTRTALHADVILPVTTFLEREDICFTNGNYLFYSARAVDPKGEAQNDYEIFRLLSRRLGFESAFTGGLTEAQWIEKFIRESEIPSADEFRRSGIYTGVNRNRYGMEDFFADPAGNPLSTPSGKIEIVSPDYEQAGGPLCPEARELVPPEEFPLMLITPHERYRIHSQNDNIPEFKKRCDDLLWMHPEDGASRNINDGDTVLVKSEIGKVLLNVRLTSNIARGVVSANQGSWPKRHKPDEPWRDNVNLVTTTEPTLPGRATRTHTNFVEVQYWSSP